MTKTSSVPAESPGIVSGRKTRRKATLVLCLEITESAVMADPDRALEILRRLAAEA